METKFTAQKIRGYSKGALDKAEKYYAMLSVINKLDLTERQIQLIAFSAIRGSISNVNVREEFCRMYKTSVPTIGNIVAKLKRKGILIKDGGKIKVNPKLVLDFSGDVILQITLGE